MRNGKSNHHATNLQFRVGQPNNSKGNSLPTNRLWETELCDDPDSRQRGIFHHRPESVTESLLHVPVLITMQIEKPALDCIICGRPSQPPVSGMCGECRRELQKEGIFEA